MAIKIRKKTGATTFDEAITLLEPSDIAPIDLTGQTVSLLTLVKALGTSGVQYAKYICKSDGGSTNISNRPTTNNAGFVCEVLCNRRGSSTDYRYILRLYQQNDTNAFLSVVDYNTTSISWTRTNTNTDINVLQDASTTTNYRPLMMGWTNNANPSSFAPVTGGVYYNVNLYAKPSDGSLYASTFYENGTSLASKYLGINGTAVNTKELVIRATKGSEEATAVGYYKFATITQNTWNYCSFTMLVSNSYAGTMFNTLFDCRCSCNSTTLHSFAFNIIGGTDISDKLAYLTTKNGDNITKIELFIRCTRYEHPSFYLIANKATTSGSGTFLALFPSAWGATPDMADNTTMTGNAVNTIVASNALKLNGQEASYYLNYNNLSNKLTAGTGLTLSNNQFSVSSANASTILNLLATGSSTPVDNDYYISQYVGGGTTTTSYHRRPMSALWSYVKGKADSVYQPKGTYAGTAVATTSANGLMSSTDKTRLDNIYTVLNGSDASKIDTIAEVYAFLEDYAQTTDLATLLANKIDKTSSSVQRISLSGSSGDTALQLKSGASTSYIQFLNSSGTSLGYLGVNASKQPCFWDTSAKRLALYSEIPTQTSQLTNNSGFLTSHQSLANYYTKSETNSAISTAIANAITTALNTAV